jgi:hypothetical protein
MPRKTPGWSLWVHYDTVLLFDFKFVGAKAAKLRLPQVAKTFIKEWIQLKKVAENLQRSNPADCESICRDDLNSFSDAE